MNVELHEGDCLEVLATLPDASVDAVVTDPPAAISFMNREWDRYKRAEFVEWMTAVMAECLRVLKPGGHALVWAIPRTSHWTATAIEDAGFEVRDIVHHLQGAGFPKSLDVAKSIDKLMQPDIPPGEPIPRTPEGEQWEGFGTALKPSTEHWILARRPLAEPSVASQVLTTGTGAINVDGCRVEGQPHAGGAHAVTIYGSNGNYTPGPNVPGNPSGRWPANLVLSHAPGCREVGVRKVAGHKGYPNGPGGKPADYWGQGSSRSRTEEWPGYADPDGTETVAAWECVEGCPVAELDRQSGDVRSAGPYPTTYSDSGGYGGALGLGVQGPLYNDHGGASRFFYTAKASATERSAGLSSRNSHPTVKPVELMRWLCRLITPPSGTILDCFCGSGSTGVAAKLEGFSFIGIDQDPESVEIAKRRLNWAVHEPTLFDLENLADE